MGSLPPPGARFGRYRVDGVLGQGAMGSVLLVTDLHLGRPAALKLLQGHLAADPGFVARFHREAEVLSRLDAPHVISVLDHDEQDGVPYLVMQHVPGGDLGALLRRHGPMPPAMALRVCAQVAEALADAHRAGVVHRDVKAGNVLVRDPESAAPFVYLSDFGLAQPDAEDATRSASGTLTAMAPERLHGAPASAASDVYAVGCLLWTCLTGAPPYRGSEAEVTLAHVRSPVPAVGGRDPMSRHLDAVLARAMAKEPGARHPDAADLARHLAAGATLPADGFRVPVASGAVPRLRPAPSRRRRRAWVAGGTAAAVLVAAGLVGAVLATRGGGPAPDDDRGARGASGGVVHGDLDGDGYGDLQVYAPYYRGAFDRAATLRWSGTPAGTLPGTPADPEDEGGQAPLAGDVDGDGDVELLVVDDLGTCPSCGTTEEFRDDDAEHVGTATVREPDGTELQHGLDLPAAGWSEAQLVGDFTGDGLDDLALLLPREEETTASSDCLLAVFPSTGEGFGAYETWAEGLSCDDAGVGDVDGDGRADVTLAGVDDGSGEPGVQVLLARDDGFEVQEQLSIPDTDRASVTWATTGDVDGDGRADLVVALSRVRPQNDYSQEHLLVFPGTADGLGESGEWGLYRPLPDLDAQQEVGLTDVDGDGRADLVVAAFVKPGGIADEEPADDVPITLWRSDGSSFTAEDGPVCSACGRFGFEVVDGVTS